VHSGPDAAAVYVPARSTRRDVRAPDTTAGVAAVAHDDRGQPRWQCPAGGRSATVQQSTDARAL